MNKSLGRKAELLKDDPITILYNKMNSNLPMTKEALPKMFHLVWIGDKELPYIGEVSIRSIRAHNPDFKIVLHHTNKELINNDIVKSCDVICNHINNLTEIEGVSINRITGQSDLIRLLTVNLYGGIYIDLDIVILKSFEDLRMELFESNAELLMGFEKHHTKHLYINNGLIMGKKNNAVIKEWLSQFARRYNSSGWSEHGVNLITDLYKTELKSKMIVKPGEYFHPIPFKYICSRLTSSAVFTENSYSVHLFNKMTENIMNLLDKERENYIYTNTNLLCDIIGKGLNINFNDIDTPYSDTSFEKVVAYTDTLKPIQIKCLQSIRYHNPILKIVVFTAVDLNTALLEGLNINIVKINNKVSKFKLLNKFGGMYIDLDTICLQSFKSIFEVFEEQNLENGILVCKEMNKKQFDINDGVILTKPGNPIIQSVMKFNGNSCKALMNEYKLNTKSFILLSHLNFNPVDYRDVAKVLKSEDYDPSVLNSAFGINLFAKSSYNILDEALANENSFLNYIMDIGLGKKNFYNTQFNETINYINLFYRPERKLFFIATWSRLFTDLKHFNAIKTEGKINGCGKSHHTIVQNSSNEYCIVLEDDAIPTEDFINVFPSVLEYAKNNTNDYDLLTLATPTLLNGETKKLTAEKINDHLIRIGNCSSSHFIIYTKSILPFFDKFYYELSNNKTKETNQDWYFNMTPEIRKVVSYPFLSLQYFGFCSDVVSATREDSFFKKGMQQLEIIKDSLNRNIKGNLYSMIPKKYMF